VFDTSAYFSCTVPVMATTRPLLKSAVCALAAKHLQHIHRRSAANPRDSPSSLDPFIAPFSDGQVDWEYQSAEHYHQAIGHLKSAINYEAFGSASVDKKQLLAAVAILCTYELMDAPGMAWKAHLNALPLFSPAPESLVVWSPVTIPHTKIEGPIFWSLARQDLLCSCNVGSSKLQGGSSRLTLPQLSARPRHVLTSKT
jgi:hypothetical protein